MPLMRVDTIYTYYIEILLYDSKWILSTKKTYKYLGQQLYVVVAVDVCASSVSK